MEIPTKRQAEQLLADRLRPINSGHYRPSSLRTLGDYAETIWLPGVLPTLKHSTKKYYQYMLRFHLYPTFADVQLRLITRDAVQSFLSAKLRSGLSWRTVKGLRPLFGTVMAAAEADEIIPSNPVRKTRFPRRGPAKDRAVIAPDKIQELLIALPEPSRSLAHLLVFTGLRIGELLALRWQDVDLERRGLRLTQSVYDVHFDEPKSQRSKRSIPLGARSIEILAARKPAGVNPDALVFSTRYGDTLGSAQSRQSTAQADLQKAGTDGSELALAAARERNSARCGGHSVRYSAGASWAFVFCDNPRRLLAFDPVGRSRGGAKSRGFAYPTKLTQVVEFEKTGSSLIQ